MLCVSRWKRALCCLLTATVVFTLSMPTVRVYAAGVPSDIKGHWAESYIKEAISKGILSGYPDGTFKPNNNLTRAEFTHILNATLGNEGASNITFSDVPSNEWYYNDVKKGVNASYISGYDDGTFKPGNPVTRQEAAVILARILPIYASTGNLSAFPDKGDVAEWAYSSLERVNAKGYIGTFEDGKLHPTNPLTRAQVSKIICDILSKESIVKTDPSISTDNTKEVGKIFSNNVTISSSLGNGSATLNNCVVLGTLNVQGGGENTVTLSSSRINRADVARSSGDPVRVLLGGETNVLNMTAARSATIQASALAGGNFGPGAPNIQVQKGAKILFSGNFPAITLVGSGSEVTITSGTVDKLTVDSGASNSDVTVESTATIKDAQVNGQAAFHGSGAVKSMTVNANGVTYAKKPENLVIGKNVNDNGSTQSSDVTINPKNGATGVEVKSDITITFDDKMTLYNGDSISNSDVKNFVELRRGSSSGNKIAFSGSINSAKKVITIDPDASLDEGVKYYVSIDKNKLKNSNGNGNSAFSSYFTTIENGNISSDPKNGETNVSVRSDIEITFKSAMKLYNGRTITDSKIDDFLELRKGSEDGKLVSYNATINNAKKVITIDPNNNLDDDERYYVIINKNELKDSDDKGNKEFVSWFSTGDDKDSLTSFNPKNGATNISVTSDIDITFEKAITFYDGSTIARRDSDLDEVVELRKGSSNGTRISFDAEISTNKKTITIDPDSSLAEGTTYYVVVKSKKLKTSDGTVVPSSTSHFTTRTTTVVPTAALTSLTVISSADNSDWLMNNFKADTTSYDVSVPFGTKTVKVAGTADSSTTVTISDDKGRKELGTLDNIAVNGSSVTKVTVTVVKANANSRTYTLNIKVKGNVKVESYKIEYGDTTTTPTAGSDTSYSFNVPAGTKSVRVTAITTDKDAKVVGLEKDLSLNGDGTTNEFSFNVTSNSDTLTYKLTIIVDNPNSQTESDS